MTREDYIKKLEALLKKHLPNKEVEDIIRDYNEYFEDGYRQSKSDLEIATKLGSPEMIAQQFIDEFKGEKPTTEVAGDIFEDIKDKTVKGFENIKNATGNIKKGSGKIKEEAQKLREMASTINDDMHNKQKGSGFFAKIGNLIIFLLKVMLILIVGLIGLCIIAPVTFGLVLLTITLVLFGIVVLAGGILLSGFSIYLIPLGIVGGIMSVSLGGLVGILSIYIIMLIKKVIIAFIKCDEKKTIGGQYNA